jgi:hypothetical protein
MEIEFGQQQNRQNLRSQFNIGVKLERKQLIGTSWDCYHDEIDKICKWCKLKFWEKDYAYNRRAQFFKLVILFIRPKTIALINCCKCC